MYIYCTTSRISPASYHTTLHHTIMHHTIPTMEERDRILLDGLHAASKYGTGRSSRKLQRYLLTTKYSATFSKQRHPKWDNILRTCGMRAKEAVLSRCSCGFPTSKRDPITVSPHSSRCQVWYLAKALDCVLECRDSCFRSKIPRCLSESWRSDDRQQFLELIIGMLDKSVILSHVQRASYQTGEPPHFERHGTQKSRRPL